MSDYNDSMDPVFQSKAEMIRYGLNIGAAYVLICMSSEPGEPLEPVFVMPGECIGTVEKACWRSSFSVETIDLEELRYMESVL
jgi:hypothetical protein